MGLRVRFSSEAPPLPDASTLPTGSQLVVRDNAWTVVNGYLGAGLPLVLTEWTVVGDGTEQTRDFTPTASFDANRKYSISGMICVWTTLGEHVASVRVTSLLLISTGSTWVQVPGGESSVFPGAVVDDYFLRAGSVHTPGELPGFFNREHILSLAASPLPGRTVRVEFRGTISDFGATP